MIKIAKNESQTLVGELKRNLMTKETKKRKMIDKLCFSIGLSLGEA